MDLFTFNNKRELRAPVLWMLLSDSFRMVPSVLAFIVIYQLGGALSEGSSPNMNMLLWLGGGLLLCFPIQYTLERLSYKNTYGKAYTNSA